jgi:hypothetical protein
MSESTPRYRNARRAGAHVSRRCQGADRAEHEGDRASIEGPLAYPERLCLSMYLGPNAGPKGRGFGTSIPT